MKQTDYDIVIAGGGMIGSSLGLALAPLGLRVAVVEAVARTAEAQPSFDDRSTALSRSTQRTYEAMGLWQRIEAGATPIRSVHVSDRGRFGFSHIDAGEQQVEALGYVVINRILGRVLKESLSRVAGLDVHCPARITSVSFEEHVARVGVEAPDGRSALRCRLLVAADGAGSGVRDMVGIAATRIDYEQHAVIGNVLPEIPPANRAFERFTEQGALALLPISDDRAAFVWNMPPQAAAEVLQLDDPAFTARLQDAFGLRLGEFSKVGARAAYPLALTRAANLVTRRTVLVGNAAHGLHPVAAQGFNLGMRDVAALCDCIADTLGEGSPDIGRADRDIAGPPDIGRADRDLAGPPDIGSSVLLDNYSKWRRPDQKKLVQLTDGIVRLFGSSRPPVRALRNLGMLGFDLVPGVRRLFARHTMGLAGRLPRLSRGVPLK